MIVYVANVLIMIIIFGDLFSIFNILLGNYTSVFVRYFTVAYYVVPGQLEKISENKEKEKKFKSLVISSEITHILSTLLLLGSSFSTGVPGILWICLFSYYASSLFFRYRIRKLLESNS